MSRRPAVVVAAAGVVCAVVGLGLRYSRHDSGDHESTGPYVTGAQPVSTALVSSTFCDLTLRHPASWRLVASDEGLHESGPGHTLGYLTDQVVVTAECSSSGAVTTCEPAVRHLEPGGIVITVSQSGLNLPITANTTVGGKPAAVTRSTSARCADATATTYEVDARIQTSPQTKGDSSVDILEIDACVAFPVSAQTRQSIAHMLETATF